MIPVGLTIISVAWILQFVYLNNNEQKITVLFPLLYSVGILLLVIEGFMTGSTTVASLNVISLLISFLVFLKINKWI